MLKTTVLLAVLILFSTSCASPLSVETSNAMLMGVNVNNGCIKTFTAAEKTVDYKFCNDVAMGIPSRETVEKFSSSGDVEIGGLVMGCFAARVYMGFPEIDKEGYDECISIVGTGETKGVGFQKT